MGYLGLFLSLFVTSLWSQSQFVELKYISGNKTSIVLPLGFPEKVKMNELAQLGTFKEGNFQTVAKIRCIRVSRAQSYWIAYEIAAPNLLVQYSNLYFMGQAALRFQDEQQEVYLPDQDFVEIDKELLKDDYQEASANVFMSSERVYKSPYRRQFENIVKIEDLFLDNLSEIQY